MTLALAHLPDHDYELVRDFYRLEEFGFLPRRSDPGHRKVSNPEDLRRTIFRARKRFSQQLERILMARSQEANPWATDNTEAELLRLLRRQGDSEDFLAELLLRKPS